MLIFDVFEERKLSIIEHLKSFQDLEGVYFNEL